MNYREGKIPEATVQRLSIYLRFVTQLHRDGIKVVSSYSLSQGCGVKAAQVRKDFAYFGELGVRGVGYYVNDLQKDLKAILGLEHISEVALVGAGHLGSEIVRLLVSNGDHVTVMVRAATDRSLLKDVPVAYVTGDLLNDPDVAAVFAGRKFAAVVNAVRADASTLVNLMKYGQLPQQFLQQPEWRQIAEFSEAWADQTSLLRKHIKCFWLEFDMPATPHTIFIPSVFFGPEKLLEGIASNESSKYHWLLDSALPLLRGQQLSKKMQYHLVNCIKKLPATAFLFQVGTMLSRSSNEVRLYINRIHPKDIIPYLKTLGWSDKTGEFQSIIDGLQNKADRFVFSFDVTEKGIGPRLGIERSAAD